MEQQLEQQNEIVIAMSICGLIVLAVLWYLQKTQRRDGPRFTNDNSLIAFIIVATVGVAIRFALAYQMPGYQSDMDCFRAWARDAYAGGLDHFYDGEFFADYPPLYVYVLWFLGWLQQAAGLEIMGGDFALILRLPSIVCEVVLAYLLYRWARRQGSRNTAVVMACFVMLNPAMMMNSSVWGQIDAITVLFMVGCLWEAYRERPVLASALFMLGFLAKPQTIMIAPVLIFAYARYIHDGRKRLGKSVGTIAASVAVMVALWYVVPLPFGAGREPNWLISRYLDTMGSYDQASLNALNVYSLFGANFLSASDFSFLGIGLPVWGMILVGVICAYALWLFVKKHSGWFLFALAAFIIMGVYACVHSMHERYVYPVPIFLLIAYVLGKDRRLLDCAALSFAVLLLGQAMSLYYYAQWIPMYLLGPCSVLSLFTFGYLAYTVTSIALKGPEPQVLAERRGDEGPSKERRIERRLAAPLGYVKCDRKDLWICLLICAVYSVVAFSNLGTFDIPQTSQVIEDEAVFEFPETERITTFKYYADYGEGVLDVSYSEDGDFYRYADMTASDFEGHEITHEVKNLYKWQVYELDINARYVKIQSVGEDLPILEVGFFGPDGNQIVPSKVTMGGEEITALSDEQSMIPYEPTYLTDFYFDEIYHVRTAYENIHGITPYEITHPPLGKIIIALGIQMFGMNSIGWRVMGTFAGVCMIPVMYVLARMLLKERKYAVFASVLLAADGMHFAQTRIGTVDSYSILWIMAMYLFMYRYAATNFNRQPLRKTLIPLFLSGLFFGIGAATKWLCLYAGVGLLVIYVFLMYRRHQEYLYARKKVERAEAQAAERAAETEPETGEIVAEAESGPEEVAEPGTGAPAARAEPEPGKPAAEPEPEPGEIAACREIVDGYRKKLIGTLLWSVLFFIIIPAIIYVASYAPYVLVTDGGAYDFQDILGNQSYMLNYHAYLNPDHVHPFASKWYTWPADVRPVLFFSNQTDTTIATLSTMGNPLLWWIGVVAVICVGVWAVRDRRYRNFGVFFIGVAALAQYAPWWLITREVFIYHYFAVVPFLVLFVVYWLKGLERDYKWGKKFGYGVVVACCAFFALFYPVITGVPAPKDYINGIRWLQSWPFY